MTRLVTATKIQNVNVNGGLPINLQCTGIVETQEAYTKVYGAPNALGTPSYSTQLQGFSNSGFGNSKFKLTGVVDLKTDHVTGSSAVFDREFKNNLLEYAWQKSTLYDDMFITTTNTVGSISVVVLNITINRGNDSDKGHFLDYTLALQEVY